MKYSTCILITFHRPYCLVKKSFHMTFCFIIIIFIIMFLGFITHYLWTNKVILTISDTTCGNSVAGTNYFRSMALGPPFFSSGFMYRSIFLLLILSGDVEVNPGPITGKYVYFFVVPINTLLQVTQ